LPLLLPLLLAPSISRAQGTGQGSVRAPVLPSPGQIRASGTPAVRHAEERPAAEHGALPAVPISRGAATIVMTDHPSSIALAMDQYRDVKQAMGRMPAKDLLQFLRKPFVSPDQQVEEFVSVSLKQGLATGKMIDYEGRDPAPPDLIPRHVAAIENAGMRAGIDGDRLLLVRLPGAGEKSEQDRARRSDIIATIAKTNLARVRNGKPLPVDRLIIPEAKSLDEMIEVHDSYDRASTQAVDEAIAQHALPAAQRDEVLRALRRIQVVPLVESSDAVVNLADLGDRYLSFYTQRFGAPPAHLILMAAGSDLNREIGPVAGQVARSIMRSRLQALQERHPGVDIIQWSGIGSGPMRSGPGRFPEELSKLHPGSTFTVQPDQLEQDNVGETLREMTKASAQASGHVMTPDDEKRLLAMGAAFANVHGRLSIRSSLATVRLNNLLAPLNQRGRKSSGSNLLYEKDGEVYLRSAQPNEANDGKSYGRTLDLTGYADQLEEESVQKHDMMRWQKAIDTHWPRGLSDPRAIGGSFARYIQGEALTTVAGLGHAIEQAQARGGRREVNELRPFITFLVKNDGFVLTRDPDLVRRRTQLLHPQLSPEQVERQVHWYFEDIAKLEKFLGKRLEDVISHADRAHYEQTAAILYKNPTFQRYMSGGDIRLKEWTKIMDDLMPMLQNPSWNRLGSIEWGDGGPNRLS
jgi:phosphoenolpyruvate carboxylase